jgi:hypothetical protein
MEVIWTKSRVSLDWMMMLGVAEQELLVEVEVVLTLKQADLSAKYDHKAETAHIIDSRPCTAHLV